MEIRPSTISGAGRGLFATKSYNKGEILGTYHGFVVGKTETVSPEKEDYLFTREDGQVLCPDDGCLLSYANDAIDLHATVESVLEWVGTQKKIQPETVDEDHQGCFGRAPPDSP